MTVRGSNPPLPAPLLFRGLCAARWQILCRGGVSPSLCPETFRLLAVVFFRRPGAAFSFVNN